MDSGRLLIACLPTATPQNTTIQVLAVRPHNRFLRLRVEEITQHLQKAAILIYCHGGGETEVLEGHKAQEGAWYSGQVRYECWKGIRDSKESSYHGQVRTYNTGVTVNSPCRCNNHRPDHHTPADHAAPHVYGTHVLTRFE
ncbi:hypothetical protein E2C01_004546 [Portunus trituberculatus]|uniref:Uncharacterized protein n=1 Tax=Portunus trituberculatus TaxID=210409 RepID=A0A5B7CSM1_PORTR|nr:hypothetical protein [Portunus trituberculatus]